MFITSPEKFAALFNEKYLGTYRQITAQDVRDMATCCLIGRYECYLKDDLEFTRGMLQYEQMRAKRSAQPTLEDNQEPPKCKRCKQPLPLEQRSKKGRPREYCSGCESFRNKERYSRWQKHKKRLFAKSSSGCG